MGGVEVVVVVDMSDVLCITSLSLLYTTGKTILKKTKLRNVFRYKWVDCGSYNTWVVLYYTFFCLVWFYRIS